VFAGVLVRALADRAARRRGEAPDESELGPGNLFATGLVAGGALAGVAVAILTVKDSWKDTIDKVSIEHLLEGKLGPGGYQVLGLLCFVTMGAALYRVATRRTVG